MNFFHFLKKHQYHIIFSFIILLAIIVRFYALSANPVALNQDEAVNGYDAYSLAQTLRDHHGTFLPLMLESYGDWVSPVLTYLTIPFVKVFGLSVFVIRMPVALLGVFSVILCYILLKQFAVEEKLALLGAFLFAIIPWDITLSRWAIPPSIVPFFLLTTIVLCLSIQNEKRNTYFWIKLSAFVFSGVILTFSYPTQKVFAPLLMISLCLIYFRKKIKVGIIAFGSYLCFIAPIYLVTILDPAKYNSRFNNVSIFPWYHSHVELLYQIIFRYIQYLLPNFNFGIGDVDSMHHVPGIGSSYDVLTPFFYFGIFLVVYCVLQSLFRRIVFFQRNKLSSRWRQEHMQLLLLWLFLSPLAASVTIDTNHLLRVVQLLPLIIIFSLFGIQELFRLVTNNVFKGIFLLVILCIASVEFLNFTNIYAHQYPDESKHVYQYGLQQSFTYAIKHEKQYQGIYVDDAVNEPYIYYLFYSGYNPKKINYKELNKYFTTLENYHVKQIGKFHFGSIPDLTNSKIVYQVTDSNTVTWFQLYDFHNNLYIKRVN